MIYITLECRRPPENVEYIYVIVSLRINKLLFLRVQPGGCERYYCRRTCPDAFTLEGKGSITVVVRT